MSKAMVLGILGWPVAHSRSPAMQNAALAALGIAGSYVPFEVKPESLGDAVRGLRALGVDGVNVTLPHKLEVMAFLDEVDPDARAIGAVNTIAREGDRLLGFNTDAPGLVRSLEASGVALRGARVVVLGAGGAARAAAVGIARAGAARIFVAARRPEQAETLITELGSVLGCPSSAGGMDALATELAGCDLLVQSTSATLHGNPAAQPFADGLPLDALPPGAVVSDLVYQPLRTTVLAAAEARGLRTVDGLGMLLHQGALSFERWTGRQAPVEVMRAALGL